jgi:pimeloyl-ACP methyl ester carboxylesterase
MQCVATSASVCLIPHVCGKSVFRLFLSAILTSSAALALHLLFLLAAPALALAQADYAREKRWADEIVPAILVGDAIQLELPNARRCLAIYAARGRGTPGVIVVHGAGMHPDWGLINVIRSQLTDGGYGTLSVQMPVMSSDVPADQYRPLFPEAAERLKSAAHFLRSKGHTKIAVVAHSLGAQMTNYFVQSSGEPIDAWVAIGLSGAYSGAERFKAPVLDLYGERDFPAVRDNAGARADAIRRVRGSAQIEVPGADHFFQGEEVALVRHIKRFLDQRLK